MDELKQVADRTKNEVDAIRAMNTPFEIAALDHYAKCHDLGEVLTYVQRLTAQRQEQALQEKPKTETRADVTPDHTKPLETILEPSADENEEIRNELEFDVMQEGKLARGIVK